MLGTVHGNGDLSRTPLNGSKKFRKKATAFKMIQGVGSSQLL
jgi:hypothetical protein